MSTEVKIKVTGLQEGTTDEEITTEAVGTMLYKEPYYYVSKYVCFMMALIPS